jgi:hypothetical protein
MEFMRTNCSYFLGKMMHVSTRELIHGGSVQTASRSESRLPSMAGSHQEVLLLIRSPEDGRKRGLCPCTYRRSWTCWSCPLHSPCQARLVCIYIYMYISLLWKKEKEARRRKFGSFFIVHALLSSNFLK